MLWLLVVESTWLHTPVPAAGFWLVSGLLDRGLVGGYSDYDAYVAKLDTAGNVLWSTTVGGSFKQRVYQTRETPDGGYVAAGWNSVTDFANDGAAYLIRLNSAGDTLWTRTYPNPGPGSDQQAYCVGVMPDSGFVLAGKQRYWSMIGSM